MEKVKRIERIIAMTKIFIDHPHYLMDGEIPFDWALQSKLCVVLGVEAYNGFVREYNGK